jgi:hypothetical protein
MGARRIVEPSVEPITLEEARLHVQLTETWQDPRLADAIRGARDQIERFCQRALLTQVWELTIGPASASLASGGLAGGWGRPGCTDSHADDFVRNLITCRDGAPYYADATATGWPVGIELPYAAPLQAIEEVTLDGVTLEATAYAADFGTEPARLSLDASGTRLVVRYRCGALEAAAVPPSLKEAMYVLLGTSFAYREAGVPDVAAGITVMPLSVEQRLEPYRLAALA